MNRYKQVNIYTVAQEAGVSIKTVSRVINNLPDVSPETRQRIQEVIEKLGYEPNAIARGLVSQKTRTLGLINADFTDANISLMICGAKNEALKHGYLIVLGSTEIVEKNQPEYVRLLTNRYVEGIIFVRPRQEPVAEGMSDVSNLNEILNAGIPVVALTSLPMSHPDMIVVDADNVYGGTIATQYLLDLGHRRLAMITGPSSATSVQAQTRGFQLALEKANIPMLPRLIANGDWSYESGVAAMDELLKRGEPFTGLVAQNDRMALGAMSALKRRGLQVPRDISIIGYDGEVWTEYCQPPLTTVYQPFQEMGASAARLLIEAIENKERSQQPQNVISKPELVERDSCARIG